MGRSRVGRKGKRAQEMEFVIEKWKAAHPEDDGGPIQPHVIAPWATKRGLWKRPPVTPEEQLRKEIALYLKNSYIIDPQGREVRENHAVPIMVQTPKGMRRFSEYYDLFHAPKKHMMTSAQLRRRSALADVAQLELDLWSWNDNNVMGEKIDPMDFNFNKDLAEMKMPKKYPAEAPPTD